MIPAKRGEDYYSQKMGYAKKSNSLHEIIFCFGLACCIVSLLIFYLFQSIQYTELSYQLQQSKVELEVLRKENHQLDLEMARLSALDRIERVARRELGMLDPKEMEYLVLHQQEYEKDGILPGERASLDELIKDFVFNWLEIISKAEAGTLFD